MQRAGDRAAAVVRRILPAEWALYRNIRLRSLSADPGAFCTTAEEESSKDESHWIEKARFAASSDSEAIWLALRGEMAVGVAGIYLEDGAFHLCHVWVDPAFREADVGKELVSSAVTWAKNLRPGGQVKLEVNPAQQAAVRLYLKLGFKWTGMEEGMHCSTSQVIREMILSE